MKAALLFLSMLTCVLSTSAQEEKFAGLWQSVNGTRAAGAMSFQLLVGRPQHGLLYPAQITITSGNFTGTYHLLLVKKSDGQLAIGRHKFPVQEKPFSLGNWTIPFNGSFYLSSNEKSKQVLDLKRLAATRYGFRMPALAQFADSNRNVAIALSTFLKDSTIQLEKINAQPWRSPATEKILHTYNAPTYFGLVDTLHTSAAAATIRFEEKNKADNDSISVSLNGKNIIGLMDINQPQVLDVTLDTGLNILCFFADNFGAVPPNTGKLNLGLAESKHTLDFTSRENMSATFIVAKIYYYPNGQDNTTGRVARQIIVEKIDNRKTVQIDSIAATMQEITLALWDDAVEDGDSISLQINDEIYMPGIAVKKKPQFITVKLYPGDNKIIFIADNLGAISPNTSVLEIIDGKRRKSYMINTNLSQNNSIKILYNPTP